MASPSTTYTFANSTTADATQVNQNFTDIINGVTDGTKDLSISALTCAGTATFNGNVAIGNASSDTLTITAVLSGSLAMGTTFASDFGSSTVGLKSVYLGSNDSAAKTVRLIAGAVSSSYSLTLPTAVASQTGMNIISDGSGVLSFRYTEKIVTKTSTYTATGDETTILCDASGGAFTVNLPAAASFTGKHLYIKKTDSTFANAVTIDGNASETIDGSTTTTLNTQNECIKIVSDGSNWVVVHRKTTTPWTSYTPTFVGFGTASSVSFYWRRNGSNIEILGEFTTGTNTGVTGTVSFPSGLTIGTIPSSFSTVHVGFLVSDTAANNSPYSVLVGSGSPYNSAMAFGRLQAALSALTGTAFVNSSNLSLQASFPISGWNP